MCKCCEDIQFIKELNKTDNSNIKRKLKATITSISKRKGQKGIAGRVGYGSYDLNYCPMCRKEVNIVDKEEIKKIKIKKSENADTRSAKGNVSKEDLLNNSLSHIQDVKNVGYFFSELLKKQVEKHDYTKIQDIDMFYKDFTSGLQGKEFKVLPWYQKHLTERHHLNDRCPEDVNLIDILEMVIDCSVAGLARSGNIFPIKIDNEIFQKAIENTKQMIIDNVEVEE